MYQEKRLRSVFSGHACAPALVIRVFVGAGQGPDRNHIKRYRPLLGLFGEEEQGKGQSQLQAGKRWAIDALGASEAGVLGNSFSSGVSCVWLVLWLLRAFDRGRARAGRCAARICEKGGSATRPVTHAITRLTLRMPEQR